MNKIKIIELLNMISRGEEVPKTIKYDCDLYIYEEQFEDYYCEEKGYLMYKLIGEGDWKMSFALNIEIEIIEDKPFKEKVEEIYNSYIDYIYNKEDKKIKPLKLNNSDVWTGKTNEDLIVDKINEIIDYLNKEE